MNSRAAPKPSLLQTAFASVAMTRLLLFFAVHPAQAPHIRELRRRTGLGMASLQKELDRLRQLGVITRSEEGQRVVYQLDPGTEQWRAIRRLVRALAQPAEILREACAGTRGVEAAFVFGSEARGDTRPDSDVDLLLVADEDGARVIQDALSEAESLMGRDVDVVTYSAEGLRERMRDGNAFVARVSREPKQWLTGDPRDWPALEAA